MDFQARRNSLLNKLEEGSVVFFFSGQAPLRSADETYPFVVDRHFYYLTGIDRENMVLMMWVHQGVHHEILFIEPYDEALARWVGGRMKAEEATAISGVEDVRDVRELEDVFANFYNRSLRALPEYCVYLDMWQYTAKQAAAPARVFAKSLQDKYPHLEIKDIFPAIVSLRLIKDEEEISELRKAIHRTRIGIEAMMKNIRPKQNERLMEGIFDFALMQGGCKEHAFDTIAASGVRATTLHYHDNDQMMQDGELFLCDLGATENHYCADISRTFPVNGVFTERQKEIYSLVLQAQEIAKNVARPGATIREMQQAVLTFYREELPKHGLMKDVSEYYFHGIGHHLGLDTHDVDGGLGQTLQVGNVITDEPGLYIRDEGIGIRIEDDLLITEDGAEYLSQEIIKSIEDIERFMKR